MIPIHKPQDAKIIIILTAHNRVIEAHLHNDAAGEAKFLFYSEEANN